MDENTGIDDFKIMLKKAKNKQGGVTPFLGAVASSVKDGSVDNMDDVIWGIVIKRLITLKIAVSHDENYSKEKLNNFINHFAMNHGIAIREDEYKNEFDKEIRQTDFDKWRLNLTKLISLLTNSYSKQISKDSIIPVNLLYEIKEFEDSVEVINLLRNLTVNSKTLQFDKSDEVLFPKEKISEKLKFILCKIISKDRNTIKNDKFFECQNNTYIKGCEHQSGHDGKCACEDIFVTAGEIRWLKELLWWSLRYDVPIYPNSNELAHCLSYFIDPTEHKDVRDNDLMKVAETVTEENQDGCNTKLVELFKAIKENREKKEDVFNIGKTSEISHLIVDEIIEYLFSNNNKSQTPLVITTNYDTMVEDAINKYIEKYKKDDKEVKYRIIFPVRFLSEDSDSDSYTPADIRWVCLERTPHAFRNQNLIFEIHEKSNYELNVNIPTLLKLHGNPLFNIDDIREGLKDSSVEENREIKHFMVLTESDYLKSLFLKLHESDMQKLLFGIKRSYWFLGYSVSDWNVRAIIYHSLNKFENPVNDVSRGKQKKGDEKVNNQIHFNILAPNQDSYNRAFLENLEITPYHVDLSLFRIHLNKKN